MASPTMLHQGLVQLFTNSPALAVQLLRKLGAKLPPFVSIRDASADLGELSPTELRADAAIKLLDALDRVCFGIIVEAQLRFMEEKLYSFPAYATNLRVRERCPTCVLVVTPSRSVARRLRKPIVIGPGMEMKVFVIGPESIPKIRDIAEAKQNPELAVLSAMAHGRGARAIALEIATAATEACAGLESEYRLLYSDLIVKQLGVAARREFEALMALGNYEYQTDFVRNIVAREKQAEQDGLERGLQKGLEQGLQQGLQRTLTTQLRAKFAATDAELTPLSKASVQQLEAWVGRVLTANSLEEVFADE